MKNILIGTAVLAVIGLGGWAIFRNDTANTPSEGGSTSAPHETTNPSAGTTTPKDTGAQGAPTFTMAQIATHNSASSCWSTINGGVYDLTNWIGQHPGGPQAILSLCGKDGSSAFNGKHGSQPRPNNELAGFKIGVLAQ